MRKKIPQYLFAVSALLFAACSALQFTVGNPAIGLLFAVIAAVGLALFILLWSGRISW